VNDGLFVALLMSGVLYGTPLLLAALGELLAERSGVINLGVEGMMLMGAVVGFWANQTTGGPDAFALAVALVAAMIAGAGMAFIHAFMVVSLRVNQIVSGLALTILGGAVGLSSYLAAVWDLGGQRSEHVFRSVDFLGLGDLPLVGPLLFDQNVMIYISWLLVLAVAAYLYRTRMGLHVRAVGEDPASADAMGIPVTRYRYCHTLAGGAFAGLGGVFYVLAITPTWSDGVTAGAGWIALGLVIFSFWRPGWVLVGAYLFGVVTSLGFNLQARGVDLPPELFGALPYLMTVVVLVAVSGTWARGRLNPPQALGVPYSREEA
jgi:general nucleoside transport system permease protein